MSLYDFFFPQQAQAAHLRQLAEHQVQASLSQHRQHLNESLARRRVESRTRTLESRIATLEQELGQASLTIAALLHLLDSGGTVSRDAVAACVREIDAADGEEDGRISPPEPAAAPPAPIAPANRPPIQSRRQWPGGRE